jgi:hypothetical protein
MYRSSLQRSRGKVVGWPRFFYSGLRVKFQVFQAFFIGMILAGPSGAAEFSEEQRLAGFQEHQRKNAEFEKSRSVGADQVKEKRRAWDEKIQSSLPEYKEKKSRQAKPLDESSPEYLQDRKARKLEDQAHEERRQAFIKQRDLKRARKKTNIKLTEEEELGLKVQVDRVEWRKRATFKSNTGKGSSSGGFSRPGGSFGEGEGGGSQDFSSPPPPPQDFNPPPPPPAPEFFEPEIPPPPPMPEFDENIPPPIFDDPGF